MMRKALVVVSLLMAVGASAGTITSLDPSTITAGSGEYFMTISGSNLGDQLLFQGPGGTFVIDINARDVNNATNVVGWVPMGVANRSGNYTVTVLGGSTGDSAPAPFTVVGPPKVNRFVLNLPDAIAVIASGKGAYVRYTVSASGGDDPKPVVTCDPPSGAYFGLGTTTVNCVASNIYGDSDKGSFTVYVHDVTPPILTLPGRMTVKADSREGAYVKFDVSASDDIAGPVPVDCDAKSGQLFKVGITTVNCEAADLSYNMGYGAFTIEVVDETSKFALHVPDAMFVEADSSDGAKVTYDVYATGTTDPAPKITCDPASGSFFKMTTTSVYCRATDAFGASAEGKFEVTVGDTTPPIISGVSATPDKLDATGSYVLVTVDAKSFDTVDPMPRCSISYVSASEAISIRDWSLASALEVKLNAITTGIDNRIYHLSLNCTDSSGNTTTDEALVTVISRGGGGANESIAAPTKQRSVRP
jgi:hypothetical protein